MRIIQTSPPPILAERYPLAAIAGLIDVLLVLSAANIAFYMRFNAWHMSSNYAVASLVIALIGIMCQILVGTYSSWRGRGLFKQLWLIYTAWLFALALITAIAVFLKISNDYSRVWLTSTLAISLGLITVFRLAVFFLLRSIRARGRNLKNVVIVQGLLSTEELDSKLARLPQSGYQVTKRIYLSKDTGWLKGLVSAVTNAAAHEVWLCLPLQEGEAIKSILHALRHLTVEVRFLPDLGDLPLLNHRISNIAGLYTLDISCSPMNGPARIAKRVEDIVIGGIISVMILPICAIIALAIKRQSHGPVIFKQYRMGINGRKFKVYKFRSMEVHIEDSANVKQASFGDPRITPLGAFLRRTSLDELPQFFNVLQGRMSIVGPRPHALAHNEFYKDLVESYMKRHKVKPGITGWAQVNGYRGETDTLDKMQKRVEYDLWYINNWSLSLDLKIIFLTVFKGFLNNKP